MLYYSYLFCPLVATFCSDSKEILWFHSISWNHWFAYCFFKMVKIWVRCVVCVCVLCPPSAVSKAHSLCNAVRLLADEYWMSVCVSGRIDEIACCLLICTQTMIADCAKDGTWVCPPSCPCVLCVPRVSYHATRITSPHRAVECDMSVSVVSWCSLSLAITNDALTCVCLIFRSISYVIMWISLQQILNADSAQSSIVSSTTSERS